jgi:hypothetical protein
MPNLSYALWSIWIELPFLHKLFSFVLFTVGAYSLFSATKVLAGLRSLMASGRPTDLPTFENEVAALSARAANTRHLITASFYLFGIVFFWGLRFALWTPDSKTPVGILVLENFFLYFAFAANAFFVFLILHLVQWFVSARVQACARSLTSSHIEQKKVLLNSREVS